MADLRLLDLPPGDILSTWLPARKGATSAAIYPKLCGWLRAASLASPAIAPAPAPAAAPAAAASAGSGHPQPGSISGKEFQIKDHQTLSPRPTLRCYTDPSHSLILLLRPAAAPPRTEADAQEPQTDAPQGTAEKQADMGGSLNGMTESDEDGSDSANGGGESDKDGGYGFQGTTGNGTDGGQDRGSHLSSNGEGKIDKDWSDTPKAGGVISAVLWVEEERRVDVRGVVENIVDQFGAEARILFSPVDRRHLPWLEAASKLTVFPEIYNVWMTDQMPEPLGKEELEALEGQGLVLDVLRDADIGSVLKNSTVPFSRSYIEELVNAPPFGALTCAVRDTASMEAVSWALTHNDFAIGSVATKAAQRGKGLGGLVVRQLARKQLRAGQPAAFAYIALDNASSQKLFQKAGFSCRQDREFLWCIADKRA